MSWDQCRFLTASVLPVRLACQCECPFCFSRSSVSALEHEPGAWRADDLVAYYEWAAARGATRLVVTGGGEPLLRPDVCVAAIALGRRTYAEIALFTNGARLSPALAGALVDGGLSYVCWSRHAVDDDGNRALMGAAAPDAGAVLDAAAAAGLPVRATCVMNSAGVADAAAVWRYIDAFRARGVRQFTFKHTYVAGPRSVFAGSAANRWSRAHAVQADPFAGTGEVVATLPWGPVIRRIEEVQVCHYFEPTPAWELANGIARSANLLSDGTVYASLEDHTSRLTLPANPSSTPAPWPARSRPATSRRSGPSSLSGPPRSPTPTGTPSPA
jgi:cyclic pyranopterin phosphate synthase